MPVIRQKESGRCFRRCPPGVTPSYIHFLDVIQILERQGVAVKISDISDYLNIPSRCDPDCEGNGKKGISAEKRMQRRTAGSPIFLDRRGTKTVEKYNENYFAGLAPYLESISEADAKVMIQTIETFYQVMCERREKFEK